MNFRQLFSAIVLATAPFAVWADTESSYAGIIERINASGCIFIDMPPELVVRLTPVNPDSRNEAVESPSAHKQSSVGYRVQVFDDNNVHTAKHEAQNRKSMLQRRFPDYRVYVTYNSPYWKVKVGDFRTRSEAEAALASIKQAFPSIGASLRVVRDHINPR